MSDPVEEDVIRHVAGLARFDLDEAEIDRFAEQFGDILDYFDALEEVPDVDAEPELVNVLRRDEVQPCLEQEEALRNAPDTEDGYVKGPRVS